MDSLHFLGLSDLCDNVASIVLDYANIAWCVVHQTYFPISLKCCLLCMDASCNVYYTTMTKAKNKGGTSPHILLSNDDLLFQNHLKNFVKDRNVRFYLLNAAGETPTRRDLIFIISRSLHEESAFVFISDAIDSMKRYDILDKTRFSGHYSDYFNISEKVYISKKCLIS
jgi:hypothetical protein